MRIVFNLHRVGLGNNGGSRTLIRCAETLAHLGAEVIMFSDIPNGYGWHTPEGVTFMHRSAPPDSDVAIATGHLSVPSVLGSDAKVKMYYLRGHEVWVAKSRRLVSRYRQLRCIVCSEWLCGMLEEHGIDAILLYPGLDFEWFYDLDRERKGIGGLHSDRHATKRHGDVVAVAKAVECDLSMLNRDIRDASPDQSREWYNGLKVWFAPTELEGLHNPPMEAALCGCALVCTDHKKSGMSDYAVHGETALVYPAGDLKAATGYVRTLLENEDMRRELNGNMVSLLMDKIGDRKTNMRRLLSICEEQCQ